MDAGELITLPVEHGALREVPPGCFESHSRGKNWLATIQIDPRAPGGLARVFQPRGYGDFYYLTEGLLAGTAVEFGADYYSGGGHKRPNRWYGVVLEVRSDAVVLQKIETAREAVTMATELEQKLGTGWRMSG
jgi:hypothetical protein